MALMPDTDIKDRFELWDKFCTVAGSAKTPAEIFTLKVESAEQEFGEYLTVDETTITDPMKRHFLAIVRYHCYRIKHGDDMPKKDPVIVQDYKDALKWLAGEKKTSQYGAAQGLTTITAKDRLFGKGTWFTGE